MKIKATSLCLATLTFAAGIFSTASAGSLSQVSAEDIFEMSDAEIHKRVDETFTVKNFYAYPGAFYGKVFTNKKTDKDVVHILAGYPENDYQTPDLLIKHVVGPFLNCASPKIPTGEKDEMYESETFSGCKVEGTEIKGEVFVTGGFYSVVMYEDGVTETETELARWYNRDFQDRLCAQDCISMEDINDNRNSLAAENGYVVFPTFSYPLENSSYVAKSYIKPEQGYLYSYQINEPAEKSGDIENGIKKFCGSGVAVKKSQSGYEFSGCVSKQKEDPINTSGNVVLLKDGKKDIVVLSMWSDNMPENDRKMFTDETKERAATLNPQDFE